MERTIRFFESPVALEGASMVYQGMALSNGAFPFRTPDQGWGLADEKKQILCPPQYGMLLPFPGQETRLLLACRAGQWGLLDQGGQETLPCQWTEIMQAMEGLIALRRGGLWGFARETERGFVMASPIAYGAWMASPTRDGAGVLFVRQDTPWGGMGEDGSGMMQRRWGMLDGQGRMLAAPQWKNEPQIQGGTNRWRRIWHITDAWLDLPEGRVMLVEDECLAPAVKEGKYR